MAESGTPGEVGSNGGLGPNQPERAQKMACPKCGCKTVYQFDGDDDPQDDRLERCAACGEIFDLDDHADEDDDE